ncbi:AMP_1a_G0014530.mRNA.1.CDS.1 [Saccharomyces cerevisiae]|nr:AMP_1a_G0014530.mRNA.1.CDS.1 [Saccharomyces cerevisiae]CAI6532541.1 AMP_1a_G0014530.mRNA.1.CDS.1 [Saccharomyces cerevisiae]
MPPPGNGMTALIIGFLVAAIGMALGYQTSFTINPARDLGPRIFASMIGYGPHAFHLTHWWWTWGAWGGPIAGGIVGALIYDIFIFTGCESDQLPRQRLY